MQHKNKKVKKEKRSIAELLACDYDIPAEVLCGGCFVEMRGRYCVSVRGCRKIILYSESKVILKMKREILQILGKRLSCITYTAGAVTIEGIIDSVSYVRDRCEEEVK